VNGAAAKTVSSLSVFLGAVDVAPHNQFAFAIYSDVNGTPGNLVAQSGIGIVKANAWNTLPVSATLASNTAYWLVYNSNGSAGWANNTNYNNDPTSIGLFTDRAFGTWPASLSQAQTGGWRFSIVANLNP
jgi:hypothetical protein